MSSPGLAPGGGGDVDTLDGCTNTSSAGVDVEFDCLGTCIDISTAVLASVMIGCIASPSSFCNS